MSKIIDIEEVLRLFVEESERKYNVRETARKTGITPSSASKYLSLLSKEGLLLRKSDRNMVLFVANTENRNFKDFKVYYNIKKLRVSGLIDFIEKELNYPEVIILFGSYSKGENTKRSDIDLFIISESKIKLDLSEFQKSLGSEVQTFIHTRKEVETMKLKNKELLNNIINGIRLSGFFEVFR